MRLALLGMQETVEKIDDKLSVVDLQGMYECTKRISDDNDVITNV